MVAGCEPDEGDVDISSETFYGMAPVIDRGDEDAGGADGEIVMALHDSIEGS